MAGLLAAIGVVLVEAHALKNTRAIHRRFFDTRLF
jgi:hypothetical protein